MTTIYFVRHGKAAAGFDGHIDPGLNDLGREQAEATAKKLSKMSPMPIYSSPLARAQETSVPLCRIWDQQATIEPRVAEIPSPTQDLTDRTTWLRGVMAGGWQELSTDLLHWRQELINCLVDMKEDCVIFSHFIAINAAVGVAQDDDRLVVFKPDNASVTTLTTDGDHLQVASLGRSIETLVG